MIACLELLQWKASEIVMCWLRATIAGVGRKEKKEENALTLTLGNIMARLTEHNLFHTLF